LLADERAWFDDHEAEAKKLLAIGDQQSDGQDDHAGLAAMTVVCQAILNLDATVWKR
jgi:hypothetical protein